MVLVSLSPHLRLLQSASLLESAKDLHQLTPIRHEGVPLSAQRCTRYDQSLQRSSLLPASINRRLESGRHMTHKRARTTLYAHLFVPPTGLCSSPTPKTQILKEYSLPSTFVSTQFLQIFFLSLAIQFFGPHHPPTAEAVWRESAEIEISFDSRNDARDALFVSNHAAAHANEDISTVASITSSSAPDVGLVNGRLQACSGSVPCVSTSSFRSPSRFMPPWTYLGSQSDAFRNLQSALARSGAIVERDDGEKYIYATITNANDKLDVDDLEFLFNRDGVLCFRSISRLTRPDPPFCWWKGCISGPRNRGRLEALRDDLGWVPMETDEEKKWVPVLLH